MVVMMKMVQVALESGRGDDGGDDDGGDGGDDDGGDDGGDGGDDVGGDDGGDDVGDDVGEDGGDDVDDVHFRPSQSEVEVFKRRLASPWIGFLRIQSEY